MTLLPIPQPSWFFLGERTAAEILKKQLPQCLDGCLFKGCQEATQRRARRQSVPSEQGHEGGSKGLYPLIKGLQGLFATDGIAQQHGDKVNDLIASEAAARKTHAVLNGSQHCKRYHKRGPLAIPKVSHFPQESAMLERKFEQSGGKERCIPWHFEMKFAPGS